MKRRQKTHRATVNVGFCYEAEMVLLYIILLAFTYARTQVRILQYYRSVSSVK